MTQVPDEDSFFKWSFFFFFLIERDFKLKSALRMKSATGVTRINNITNQSECPSRPPTQPTLFISFRSQHTRTLPFLSLLSISLFFLSFHFIPPTCVQYNT